MTGVFNRVMGFFDRFSTNPDEIIEIERITDYSAFFLISDFFPPPYIANFVQVKGQFFCSYGHCVNVSPECRIMKFTVVNDNARITFSNGVEYDIPMGNALLIQFFKNLRHYYGSGSSLFDLIIGSGSLPTIPEPRTAIIDMSKYFELSRISPKANTMIESSFEDDVTVTKLFKKPQFHTKYHGHVVLVDKYTYSDDGEISLRSVIENTAESIIGV